MDDLGEAIAGLFIAPILAFVFFVMDGVFWQVLVATSTNLVVPTVAMLCIIAVEVAGLVGLVAAVFSQ